MLGLLRFPRIAVTNSDDTFWMPFSLTSCGLFHQAFTRVKLAALMGIAFFFGSMCLGFICRCEGLYGEEF